MYRTNQSPDRTQLLLRDVESRACRPDFCGWLETTDIEPPKREALREYFGVYQATSQRTETEIRRYREQVDSKPPSWEEVAGTAAGLLVGWISGTPVFAFSAALLGYMSPTIIRSYLGERSIREQAHAQLEPERIRVLLVLKNSINPL